MTLPQIGPAALVYVNELFVQSHESFVRFYPSHFTDTGVMGGPPRGPAVLVRASASLSASHFPSSDDGRLCVSVSRSFAVFDIFAATVIIDGVQSDRPVEYAGRARYTCSGRHIHHWAVLCHANKSTGQGVHLQGQLHRSFWTAAAVAATAATNPSGAGATSVWNIDTATAHASPWTEQHRVEILQRVEWHGDCVSGRRCFVRLQQHPLVWQTVSPSLHTWLEISPSFHARHRNSTE